MAFHHSVVAAVDFSEISPTVAQKGLRVARKLGERLVVVHVLEDLTGGEEEGPILPALRRRVEATRQEASRSMEQFLRELDLEGAEDVAPRIVNGVGGPCVARGDGGVPAALVVIGAPHPSHSFGSFGASVLKECSCPVLISRRPAVSGYRNVLVGVDLSPQSERAWNLALDLAEPDATVTAFWVDEQHGHSPSPDTLEAWVRERARGHRVATRIEAGSPRVVLVQAADEASVDLLTVGRAGHNAFRDLLLGSTAQSVAQKAPCDVLVVGAEVRSHP